MIYKSNLFELAVNMFLQDAVVTRVEVSGKEISSIIITRGEQQFIISWAQNEDTEDIYLDVSCIVSEPEGKRK